MEHYNAELGTGAAIINGALVEDHFGVLHWHLRDFDLKLGYRHHPSTYKCPHPIDAVSELEKKKVRHKEDLTASASQM
jgi:hypothetical protein